ncbi:aquaporin Z [Micrococcoides hystricis]|uniref:Aquaporin Z n=1 Tax=Micrococcoides hystricis TaxID=1572761 RepID=A0ABV6PDP3_9MICC
MAETADLKPRLTQALGAEFIGTFFLVFGGAGSALYAALVLNDDGTQLGIGFLGVALAFGLTVVTMAYAVGHISGGHFNPAVTLGVAVAKRISWKEAAAYWVTQLIAGIVAGAVLLLVASGKDGFDPVESGFASNGYGDRSPAGYSMLSVFVAEALLTFIFLIVILGSTDRRAPIGFAPLAIGLSLTLIHLISIPISNTSVNPARSLGTALFAGPEAIGQVWMFFVAPLLGAALAGLAYKFFEPAAKEQIANAPERVNDFE